MFVLFTNYNIHKCVICMVSYALLYLLYSICMRLALYRTAGKGQHGLFYDQQNAVNSFNYCFEAQ